MKIVFLIVCSVLMIVGAKQLLTTEQLLITTVPVFCPSNDGREVIFIPHMDCTKFWQCSNGIPILKICPSGLHFNRKVNICDWPHNAAYRSQEELLTTEQPPITTVPVSCPSNDGWKVIFIPHVDCAKFWQCSNGIPILKNCPNGLHFNRKINICDWPHTAACRNQEEQTAPTSTSKSEQRAESTSSTSKSYEITKLSSKSTSYRQNEQELEKIQNSSSGRTEQPLETIYSKITIQTETTLFEKNGQTTEHYSPINQQSEISSSEPIEQESSDEPSQIISLEITEGALEATSKKEKQSTENDDSQAAEDSSKNTPYEHESENFASEILDLPSENISAGKMENHVFKPTEQSSGSIPSEKTKLSSETSSFEEEGQSSENNESKSSKQSSERTTYELYNASDSYQSSYELPKSTSSRKTENNFSKPTDELSEIISPETTEQISETNSIEDREEQSKNNLYKNTEQPLNSNTHASTQQESEKVFSLFTYRPLKNYSTEEDSKGTVLASTKQSSGIVFIETTEQTSIITISKKSQPSKITFYDETTQSSKNNFFERTESSSESSSSVKTMQPSQKTSSEQNKKPAIVSPRISPVTPSNSRSRVPSKDSKLDESEAYHSATISTSATATFPTKPQTKPITTTTLNIPSTTTIKITTRRPPTTTTILPTTIIAINDLCKYTIGFLPHPTNCRKFILCSRGLARIMNCSNNGYFDPSIKLCSSDASVCQ